MFESNKNLANSINILAVILSLFLIAGVISAALDIQSKWNETENTITVSDTGTVYAKPDLAIATASVVNEAETVDEALSVNTEKMNAVIEAMKEEGVEEKDLKTTTFNIYPRYEWREASQYYPTGERILVGYEVRQSLQIKIRDLENVGQIIQEAADAGANQISDLQFTIDDQDELKKQARGEAILKAKTKAEELAGQLGVKLVRISNFSEGSVSPVYYALEKAEALGLGGGGEPQIETGESKIEVTVSITYDIK